MNKKKFKDIPIFIISLKKEKQRRKEIKNKLKKLSNNYYFFDAIDGNCVDWSNKREYLGRLRRLFYGKDLTKGELGCFFSHKLLLEKIVAEKRDMSLVFEDDVILYNDFKNVIEALINKEITWDFIRFIDKPKLNKKLKLSVHKLFESYTVTRLGTAPGGAYAYIISQTGAKKLLKAMNKIWTPNDTLMGQTWRTYSDNLIIYPPVASWDKKFESHIGDDRFKKNLLIGWEKKIYPITRAFFKLIDGILTKLIFYMLYLKNLTTKKT